MVTTPDITPQMGGMEKRIDNLEEENLKLTRQQDELKKTANEMQYTFGGIKPLLTLQTGKKRASLETVPGTMSSISQTSSRSTPSS